MEKDKVSVLFHNLLGPVSSVRNIFFYLLMEKTQPVDKKTKYYLEEGLKYCDELVKRIQNLRENWDLKEKSKS
ncbi:MAG TPA: hypothetical protein VMW41_01905 [Candidatus Bathyarchaeia archaeon]|nr:hypothetical protein [Candidatus Bathyarchaeia archaeon]